jgi:8-oxo-dGTP pyrophosphatase MutT (NUDIX family)
VREAALLFNLPRNAIFPIDEAVLRLDEGRHPYEAANGGEIAENWQAELRANPSLFDGEVVLLSQMAYADRRVEARCHAVRYSTFLHWRRQRPTASAEHVFAHAMPVCRDNALIAARMRTNTANPGQVYFAAGSFEPSDFFGGVADIDYNMMREVREETGIDLGPARRDAGYHAFSGPTGTVIVKRFYLDEDAATVAGRIARFVAAESDPEIEGPVIIRGRDDLPQRLAPHMPPLIDWHFST